MKFKLFENLNIDFNFNEDISIMTELFDLSENELFEEVGISSIDSKEDADKLYNFCYNNGLYLNDIKWQEYRELFNNSSKFLLCHGSRNGIKGPIRLDVSGESNDFGNGFYIGETLKQAGMFVAEEPNSCIYLMKFDSKGLKPARFLVTTDWMLAVAYYRGLIEEYKDHPKMRKIISKIDDCDYVVAPIADNRIFELIEAFTVGQFTDKQTLYALSATYLGMQYVLKSEKTLFNLQILDNCYLCPVEKSLYVQSSNIESITSLNKAKLAKNRYKDDGKYITELFK